MNEQLAELATRSGFELVFKKSVPLTEYTVGEPGNDEISAVFARSSGNVYLIKENYHSFTGNPDKIVETATALLKLVGDIADFVRQSGLNDLAMQKSHERVLRILKEGEPTMRSGSNVIEMPSADKLSPCVPADAASCQPVRVPKPPPELDSGVYPIPKRAKVS